MKAFTKSKQKTTGKQSKLCDKSCQYCDKFHEMVLPYLKRSVAAEVQVRCQGGKCKVSGG